MAPSASSCSDQFVSIIVPVLNEERFIEACLRSLVDSAAGAEFEILVMDGGSTDRTAAIVRAVAVASPAVKLHDNPGRLQSAAMNLGATLASPRAAVIIRADAHAIYPAGFVPRCVTALRAHDAASVVVPMVNQGSSGIQRAIATAQSSRLGNGGALHRRGGVSGFVEHGHHAAFDRAAFLRLGGYDTRFTHNEDAEFDIRLRRSGGLIWMCGDAPIIYFPRTSLRQLGKQYYKHARGRARTLFLHRSRPKLRQMAPLAILLWCLAGLLLTPVNQLFLLAPGVYLAICFIWAVVISLRAHDFWLLAAGPALAVMHLSWATGFLSYTTGLLAARARSFTAGQSTRPAPPSVG